MNYDEYIKYQIFSIQQTIAGIRKSTLSKDLKRQRVKMSEAYIKVWQKRLKDIKNVENTQKV